jgi:hypothetical protein
MHHAAHHGFDEIVDLLLSHPDIDLSAETPNHETARDLAFVNCYDGIVQKVVAARPRITCTTRVAAAEASHVESVITTRGRPRSLFD